MGALEAARQGLEIDNLVIVNGALKKDTIFPETIKHVVVVYTENDKPTRTAAFLDKVPNSWGAMGAKGAEDPRAINLDLSHVLEGHSDFWKESILRDYVPEIDKLLK